MKNRNKTWNEFWGEFLQVTFHEANPELWPSRERKALWAIKNLDLKPKSKILDLGCGDGILDIWLSRMGFKVIAVDRNSKVLEHARKRDDTNRVEFISSDLRDINFESNSFDAVIFIESTGLMSKSDDGILFKKVHSLLKPKAKFILDCPENAELKNSWSREFSNGTARGESIFDETTRIQDIQFYFKPHGQDEFGIYDPYDVSKGELPGINRYLYPRSEIREILENIGFATKEVDHYYEKNYFSLLAEKLS